MRALRNGLMFVCVDQSQGLISVARGIRYYAYNNWGGHSLYGFHSCASWGGTTASASAPGPDGSPGKDAEEIDYTTRMITEGGLQSHRVSPYRPGHGYYGSIEGRFLTWERLFLLWADRNGVPLEFWCAPLCLS